MKKMCLIAVFLGLIAGFSLEMYAGGCPLTGGGGGCSSGGTYMRPPMNGKSKPSLTYVVYKSVDMQGNVSYGKAETSEYKEKVSQTEKEVKALKKAVPAARKKWNETYPETAFPLRNISIPRFSQLRTFSNDEKAGEYLSKVKEEYARKLQKEQEYAEKKMKKLSDEEKAELAEREELCTRALAMVTAEKCAVLAEMSAKESGCGGGLCVPASGAGISINAKKNG